MTVLVQLGSREEPHDPMNKAIDTGDNQIYGLNCGELAAGGELFIIQLDQRGEERGGK